MENKIKILEQTHNARTILVQNPSKKVLEFLENMEERKRQRKKEALKEEYDEKNFIRI